MRNSKFVAEDHYYSKISNGDLKRQGTIIDFTPPAFESKPVRVEKGIERTVRENFKYEDFKKLNEIHEDYLRQLKGKNSPENFLDILHKAELTGARVNIANKNGYIIEERKNSLVVIFEEDKVKIYPKKVWDFSISFEGVDYLFISGGLKKNRFLSK